MRLRSSIALGVFLLLGEVTPAQQAEYAKPTDLSDPYLGSGSKEPKIGRILARFRGDVEASDPRNMTDKDNRSGLVFKTTAIDHSAIPPRRKSVQKSRDLSTRDSPPVCPHEALIFSRIRELHVGQNLRLTAVSRRVSPGSTISSSDLGGQRRSQRDDHSHA
jgi:hypothetical protein